MTYAIIDQNNLVVNVTTWDGQSPWQPPKGHQAVELNAEAGIGWSYIDGQFVSPLEPEPTPEEVTL